MGHLDNVAIRYIEESKLGKPLKEIDYTNPLYPVSFVYDRIV